MWVLFAILRVNNSFSYRIFRSILVLVIISQLTSVSKLFLGGPVIESIKEDVTGRLRQPVIEGQDSLTEANALIQLTTFI